MNEKIIEEPSFEPEEGSEKLEQPDAEIQAGSMYGKFKDAKTLLDAYNSLQAEFTRKSQKLAEFQRKQQEFALFQNLEEKKNFSDKGETDCGEYKKEAAEADKFLGKIGSLPKINQTPFEEKLVAENELAEEINSQEFFDKYIAKNEEIKSKILEEYLSKLNNLKAAPKIISGSAKSVHFAPNNTPKSFKEAGEIFSKMLN